MLVNESIIVILFLLGFHLCYKVVQHVYLGKSTNRPTFNKLHYAQNYTKPSLIQPRLLKDFQFLILPILFFIVLKIDQFTPLILLSISGLFLFSFSIIPRDKKFVLDMNMVMLSFGYLIIYSTYLLFRLNILEQCIFLVLLIYLSIQLINNQEQGTEKFDFYLFFMIILIPVINTVLPIKSIYFIVLKLLVLLGLVFSLDVLSKKDLKFYQYSWQRVFGIALFFAFLASKMEF